MYRWPERHLPTRRCCIYQCEGSGKVCLQVMGKGTLRIFTRVDGKRATRSLWSFGMGRMLTGGVVEVAELSLSCVDTIRNPRTKLSTSSPSRGSVFSLSFSRSDFSSFLLCSSVLFTSSPFLLSSSFFTFWNKHFSPSLTLILVRVFHTPPSSKTE